MTTRLLPPDWAPALTDAWENDPEETWQSCLFAVMLICGLVAGFGTELLMAWR